MKMPATLPTLGLVGFGQMGQLLAKLWAPYFNVMAYDHQLPTPMPEGISAATMAQVAACDYCVLAVPTQALPQVAEAVAQHLPRTTKVFDVCSVKVRPLEVMQAAFPTGQEVCGMHPIWGPQSFAKYGINGQPFVFCPVHNAPIDAYMQHVVESAWGCTVHVVSAEAHDKQMAYVQGLTHLIGQALRQINAPELDFATVPYQRLLELKTLLANDTRELFQAIQSENPFAPEISGQFKQAVSDLLS